MELVLKLAKESTVAVICHLWKDRFYGGSEREGVMVDEERFNRGSRSDGRRKRYDSALCLLDVNFIIRQIFKDSY